jgi:hypothetical protein
MKALIGILLGIFYFGLVFLGLLLSSGLAGKFIYNNF